MIVDPIASFVRGAILTAAVGAAFPASADQSTVSPGEIEHCARMSGADERLTCYDDLARRKSARAPAATTAAAGAPASSSPTPPNPPSQGASQANPAPAAVAPSAAAPPAGSQPAVSGQTTTAATTQAQSAQSSAGGTGAFGLTRHEQQVGPDVITATVSKVSYDQLGNINVSLQNGQLWTFNDSDALLRPGDTVRIKHASLGSFLMLTPDRQSHRVKRLR